MIQPGTLLQNRYRVSKQIGQGGMGAVYVATDERFSSTVAIKRTFFDDPNMSRAFEREAHLLNRLRHAALPKVSDHFTEEQGQFLIMEFIEGSDLAELMKARRGAFPLADVLRWADELLDALDYLHTQEPPVVHRDIKPQNLKLTPRGQIILLDFGLAKGASAQTLSGATASVFGYSPNFAPLEQMQGAGTDPRSDIYSLAATLYYLMTGLLPVDALARAAATVKSQPDPLRPAHLAHAQVPTSVSKVLRRAMSQNSALRHSTAAELREALRQAAGDAPQDAQRGQIVPRQGQPAPYDATVVESTVLSPAPQFDGAWRRAPSHSQLRPSPRYDSPRASTAGAHGEPRPEDSYTVPAQRVPARAGVSPLRIVGGLAAVLLVACIAAASYLLVRPSGAASGGPESKTETRSAAGVDPQSGAAEATRPTTDGQRETPNAARAADGATETTQTQDARDADASQADAARPATAITPGAWGASNTTTAASDAASAAPGPAGPTSGATGGSEGLVINNPAPATGSADDARRAEQQQQAAQQPAQSTPRRSNVYTTGTTVSRPPPPPPFDGRQPPPQHRPPPPRP